MGKKWEFQNVISSGAHKGYEWVTSHNGHGYRTGYVILPKGHPWHGNECCDIECDVHGSITFCQYNGDNYVIGFDCAHDCDAPDTSLIEDRFLKEFYENSYFYSSRYATLKSNEYVIDNCKKLCEMAHNIYQSGDEG